MSLRVISTVKAFDNYSLIDRLITTSKHFLFLLCPQLCVRPIWLAFSSLLHSHLRKWVRYHTHTTVADNGVQRYAFTCLKSHS